MRRFIFLLVVLLVPVFYSARAQTGLDTIHLSTNVETSLAMSVEPTGYDFGSLVANIPEKGSAGVNIGVETNSPNGYNLSIYDGISGSGSALLNADLVTRIIDFDGSIEDPQPWVNGESRGLGITVFKASTSKEPKWGTGTTYDDPNNKYAGVPGLATAIHTSAGYKAGIDTTDIAFIVDVNPDQKSGIYSGPVTISALAILP
jgi:hypothetical protein